MSTQEFILEIKFDQRQEQQQFEGHEDDFYCVDLETSSTCNHHEFFFFIILVATIRQLADSMELGFFIMEWAIDFF